MLRRRRYNYGPRHLWSYPILLQLLLQFSSNIRPSRVSAEDSQSHTSCSSVFCSQKNIFIQLQFVLRHHTDTKNRLQTNKNRLDHLELFPLVTVPLNRFRHENLGPFFTSTFLFRQSSEISHPLKSYLEVFVIRCP